MKKNECNCISAEECTCQTDDWRTEDFSSLSFSETVMDLEDACDVATKDAIDFEGDTIPGLKELAF